MDEEDTGFVAPIHRLYVDTRPMVHRSELPLIHTLPEEQKLKVLRYLRPADRWMSLASALLKNIFIHRYALIPWNEIKISKTPDPHRRPYWEPEPGQSIDGGLEFNVTHQAGLIALIGCKTPTVQRHQDSLKALMGPSDDSDNEYYSEPSTTQQVRLGVDVACTNEDKRTPKDILTQAKLDEWVEIFDEMFSDREQNDMKNARILNLDPSQNFIYQKLRRFYAYWALKEAYIKMVGEGLLADWLRELEFSLVVAPHPVTGNPDFDDDGFSWALRDEEEAKWTPPSDTQRNTQISLYGRRIKDVTMEIAAYEKDYIFATAIHGVTESNNHHAAARWIKLDIEKDIRPCAEGKCKCLSQRVVGGGGGRGSSATSTSITPTVSIKPAAPEKQKEREAMVYNIIETQVSNMLARATV